MFQDVTLLLPKFPALQMRMLRNPTLRAYVMLGFVMLFWAGNSIVGRAMRNDIPPFTLAFVRWAGALALLAPFAMRQLFAERAAVVRHWKPILLLGLAGVGAFNALLYSGLRYTTATNGLLLQAVIPSVTLLLGVLLFRDRAPLPFVFGTALSTLGVAAIVFEGDPRAILQLRFGLGDALILCGCLAWALYTAFLRLRPPIQPISFIFATFIIGALSMAPFALREAEAIATINWRPGIFAAFGYVAVFPSVVAYFLYNAAVAQIGPGAASQTISLMPLFGAFLAALLLGEALYAYHAVGMMLILSGVVAASWTLARS